MTLNPQDRRSGLYAIVNAFNGHRYIGSTIDFYNRTREHRLTLRRGRHHCGHLQHAWRIYGEAAFRFQVLAVLEPTELRATEARMLARNVNHSRSDVLDRHRAFHTGRLRPVDARLRMSAAAKQKSNAKRHHFNGRAQTLRAWAEEFGIKRDTLYERIGRGWSIADALTVPVNAAMRPKRFRQEADI